MKRNAVFILLILVLTQINGDAQNTFRSEWAIGASGGIGFSSVSFNPKVSQNNLIGLNGGITARWITEKNLGLQLEINFKQQGWSEKIESTEDFSATNLSYSRTMSYIDIPLFTHIYFGGEKVRFFVNLGPQIGFFLHESIKDNLNGKLIPDKRNEQHTLPIEKKFEWGLGGGPGLEFRSSIGFFLLEGRYYYGLSDFYNTRHGDEAFQKASNRSIVAKITYMVPIH